MRAMTMWSLLASVPPALVIAVASQSAFGQDATRSEKEMANERTGEQVVKTQCVKCHLRGNNGAPKIGDRAAWAPRMQKGIDLLVRSAIRGHGGMPPRGGEADLTDPELRSAVLYMFNPPSARAGSAPAATAAPRTGSGQEKSVGGLRIVVGFEPAESIKGMPAGSPEQTMHGGVPKGASNYHLNVSLFDSASGAPIRNAKVEARIEQTGLGGESKALQPMPAATAGYGAYFHVVKQASYQVVLRIRPANSPSSVEWRFDHTF